MSAHTSRTRYRLRRGPRPSRLGTPSPPAVARPRACCPAPHLGCYGTASPPRPAPGVLCTAPAVVGGRFCRSLRIRADPTPFSPLCTQCPRRSGTWGPARQRVPTALILRLRHAHEPGQQTGSRTSRRPHRATRIRAARDQEPPPPANQPRPARAIRQDAAVVPCRLMPVRHSSATRQAEMTSTVDTAVTATCLSVPAAGYGGVVLSGRRRRRTSRTAQRIQHRIPSETDMRTRSRTIASTAASEPSACTGKSVKR